MRQAWIKYFLPLFALTTIAAPAAFADDEDDRMRERELAMLAFFGDFYDDWSGTGVQEELMNDGSRVEYRFHMDLEVREGWREQSWQVRSETEFRNGRTAQGRTTFFVRDGNLYIDNQNGQMEPVDILAARANELSYFFRRANYYTGRVYEYTTELRMLDAEHLELHETVRLNNVIVAETRAEFRRW